MKSHVLALSLFVGGLAIAGPASPVDAAVGSCPSGDINISGKVTGTGGAPLANLWVELRLGVDEDTGPWLNEPADQFDQTDADGDYTICLTPAERTTIGWSSRTKWQVLAHPDLSAWTGPAAPTFGVSASTVNAQSACSTNATCTANVTMQAPTIWSTEPAHFYLVSSEDGFVVYLPGFSPGSPDLKKLAAAFPFAPGDYRVKGVKDASNDPYDVNDGSEFVLSRFVSPSSQGVVGQIVKGNFLGEIVLPNGNPIVVGEDGPYPQMFVARLVDGCDPNQGLRPDCFVNYDPYEPGKIAAQLLPGIPYAVGAQYDLYPMTAAVVMLVNGNLMIVNNPTNSGLIVDGKLRITLRAPGLLVRAKNASGAILPMDFFALKWQTTDNGSYFNYVPLMSQGASGADGTIGWSPGEGIWQIKFSQPYMPTASTSAYATTLRYVSVSAIGTPNQVIRPCTWTPGPDAPECPADGTLPLVGGALNFTVDERNVVVTVRDLDNNVVPNSDVAVRTEGNDARELLRDRTNGLGQIYLKLAEGSYRIDAGPSEETPDQAGGFRVIAVTSSATVSVPLGVDIQLTEPNFQGTIVAGNSPSAFSGISIQEKQGNGFQWLRWVNTGQLGDFSLKLDGAPSGGSRYWLTLEPPSSQPDYTRTSVYLLVSAEGAVCVTATISTGCLAEQPLVNGKFRLSLNSPNFLGRIVDPDGNPVSGWIGVEKWLEGQSRFQWIEGGSQAGMTGNFSMFLDSGTYKLGAEPFSATGLSKQSSYIRITATGQTFTWCPVTVNQQQVPSEECASPASPTSQRHVITLPGANFLAVARRVDGTPISQSWAEAWVQQGTMWIPLVSSNIRNNGTFGMRIETTPNNEWKQVRVTANPPWGSTDLVKTSKLYWVKGTTICSDVAKPASNCSPSGLVSSQAEFVLTGGNVGGRVLMPDGTAAANVQISVEKNISGDWWEWVDIWAQTSATGNYSLPLEVPADGSTTYRITARPQGRTDVGLASRTVVVDSTCTGCLASDITLALPNVTATIKNGGQAVPYSWVQVEKQRRFCRTGPDVNTCNVNDIETWWEWTGVGIDSNEEGKIALPLTPTATATTYRLVVQGPWNANSPLPRFTSNPFELQSGVTTSATLGNLSFPSANLQFTLKSGGQNVPNAWVSVEKKVNGWWQWTDVGASSNGSGKVSLYLAGLTPTVSATNDDYRLVINTPWGDSSLPTFRIGLNNLFEIPMTAGVTNVSYPGANMTGTIEVSPGVVNRYGWVEVLQWTGAAPGNWVTGLPISNTGSFATRLDDGEYLLRAHPNGTFSSGPMEIRATITGGNLTTWSYRGGSACSGGQCSSINASFANVPKNLQIVVQVGGAAPTRKVFVTIEAGAFKIGLVVDPSVNPTGIVQVRVPEGVAYTVRATHVDANDVVTSATNTATPTADTGNSRVSVTVNVP